jgi:hypothetical protein
MSEQGNRQEGIAGETDHHQYRAGPDEGVRAPDATETGISEMSIFDGKGNESVVRVMTDAEGNTVQGTGATSEEAAKDAEKMLKDGIRRGIGDAFSPGKH